jgi:hypothetical protein
MPILGKDITASDTENSETITKLYGKDAKDFVKYVHSKLTSQEKQELQYALEFYMQKCPKIIEKE